MMAKGIYLFKLLVGFLIVALIFSCKSANGLKSSKNKNAARIISSEDKVFHNQRSFVLQILETSDEGNLFRSLQIIGDDIVISFHSSNGVPIPTYRDSTITFGRHSISISKVPNRFYVDSLMYDLQSPGFFAFSEGEYMGKIY